MHVRTIVKGQAFVICHVPSKDSKLGSIRDAIVFTAVLAEHRLTTCDVAIVSNTRRDSLREWLGDGKDRSFSSITLHAVLLPSPCELDMHWDYGCLECGRSKSGFLWRVGHKTPLTTQWTYWGLFQCFHSTTAGLTRRSSPFQAYIQRCGRKTEPRFQVNVRHSLDISLARHVD